MHPELIQRHVEVEELVIRLREPAAQLDDCGHATKLRVHRKAPAIRALDGHRHDLSRRRALAEWFHVLIILHPGDRDRIVWADLVLEGLRLELVGRASLRRRRCRSRLVARAALVEGEEGAAAAVAVVRSVGAERIVPERCEGGGRDGRATPDELLRAALHSRIVQIHRTVTARLAPLPAVRSDEERAAHCVRGGP